MSYDAGRRWSGSFGDRTVQYTSSSGAAIVAAAAEEIRSNDVEGGGKTEGGRSKGSRKGKRMAESSGCDDGMRCGWKR
jgi:hypothetical protein